MSDTPNIQMVPLDRMIKDDRAQRPFDPAWAKKITDNFRSRLVGVLVVSERPTGEFAVEDGWHRRHALMAHGYAAWPCIVHHQLAVQDEAAGFTGFNNRRNVRHIDNFFVRATAGEVVPNSIIAAVEDAGWKAGRYSSDGHISAMKSLENLYGQRKDPDQAAKLIKDTLRVVTEAWGFGKTSGDGAILRGIGAVLAHYDGDIHLGELSLKLSKYPGGASGLLAKAKALRDAYRSSMANCVAEIITTRYNSGRTTHRLPDWRR
jgi:hypothetical protein